MQNSIYRQAKFLTSAHTLTQLPADRGREVAFAGRSNSGKSSVINVITDIKGLAKTSKTPGRTRLLNFFELDEEHRLVDLPGYGYAKVPGEMQAHWAQILEGYLTHRDSLMGLVLITDIRRELTDYDRQMLEWCRMVNLPVQLLLNKADKLSNGAAKQVLLKVRREVAIGECQVQLFSVLKKQGIEEVRGRLDGWLYRIEELSQL